MAFIIIDNKPKVITPAEGAYLWRILKGEINPDQLWYEYASRVKRIYLNPLSPETPKSYIEAYGASRWYASPVKKRTTEKWVPIETRKDLM